MKAGLSGGNCITAMTVGPAETATKSEKARMLNPNQEIKSVAKQRETA